MKIRFCIGLVLFLAVSMLAGCGGGGGPATSTTTTISGMASKGPIKAGTVKVYAIRGGIQDSEPLKEGPTDNNGNYTIDVGSYQGPALVEVTGGSYTDEVSGATVTLKTPMRAVFADASIGRKTVAVTPLTELAYKKAKGAGPVMTTASIDDANASIAAMFKLTDIVSTLPVAGGASDDQKKYAAACGSFAQLVNDGRNTGESLDDALPRLLTRMGNEMESGGLSLDSIGKLNDAITKFSGSDRNQTGTTITPLPAPTSGLLKLSTSGNTNNIGAIDVTVNFPAGVTVKADAATGEVAAGEVAAGSVVTISGVAAAGDNKLVTAKYTPGTPSQLHIILINATGFGPGEFVTIRFDLAGGSFPASKDAFSVAGSFAAKDLNGAALSGITATTASVSAEIK